MSYTFKLKDSVTLPLTQKLIEELATMAGSITERPLDDKRVEFIKDRINSGLAVSFHWAKAQIEGKKEWYRVNGQHSSYVLRELASLGLLPEGLIVHLDNYVVPDAEALVQLFRQFDPRQSGRSSLDVTNAYASVKPELNGVSRKIIKLAAEGIWWYRKNVAEEKDVAKGDDRFVIVMEEQYHPFIKWLDKLLSIKTPEMKLPHVIAAAYATYNIAPANASEFWEQVAGTMPNGTEDPDEASMVLDSMLTKVRQKEIDVKPHDGYQACIFAWNAYVDEKAITKISAPSWRAKGFLQPKYPAEHKIAAE